jgi:cytochrome c oxidase cbb3-type subunit 3
MLFTDRESARAARRLAARALLLVMGLIGVAGAFAGYRAIAQERLQARLLASLPDDVPRDPQLVQAAIGQGRPLYLQHCARCHGEQLQGNPALGAPCLSDAIWLYGNGTVFDIERTVMYGIRSTSPKAHNVTEMPALGLTGMLTPGQVREAAQHVLELSGRPHDGEAALAGKDLYLSTCADCHGADARGNPDYGAPDLTANVWNNGGDADSLYRSIYYGRHGVMPGWLGQLSLQQIRALAVYIHAASHPQTPRGIDDRAGR